MDTLLGQTVSSNNVCHSMPNRLPTQLYTTIDEFTLESGETLTNVTVAFTVKGRLNTERTNVIVICHALSGSAEVEDWWASIFSRPKPAFDPSKFCIICCNSLGSPYGSSSPLHIQPGGTTCYGAAFPKTTIRDDVRIQKLVMDLIGVRSIYCVIGASMGGMLAMEWALLFGKQYIRSAILISTAARQSPWAIAWAENQRSTIKSDAKYMGGNYSDDPPVSGLAAARMSAMLSYRTHSSFEKRFGRRRMDARALLARQKSAFYQPSTTSTTTPDPELGNGHHRDESSIFLAQSYLRYQGEKFNARFDANCYMHILDKIDTHDVSRGRSPNLPDKEAMREVLGQMRQPVLVIGIPSDGLYPISEQMDLADQIPNAHFASIESGDGHDGFLLEGEQVNDLLLRFFARNPLNDESLNYWQDVGVAGVAKMVKGKGVGLGLMQYTVGATSATS